MRGYQTRHWNVYLHARDDLSIQGDPLRVFGRFAAALLTVFLLLPIASAETPNSLYNKGKQAEARQDYEAAYEFYKQAYDRKPQELRYRVKYERLRFLAAAS